MKRNTNRDERVAENRPFPKRDDIELWLTESVADSIKTEVVRNRDKHKETGGILIGGQAATNQFFVVEATGPGANAHHRRTEFSPDIEHAQQRLDEMRETWDVFWVGTWHKHPEGIQRLSGGDIRQMRRLVKDPDTLDDILSVIVTPENVRLRAYHMDDGLEPHRINTTIVEDDIPIRKQFLRDSEPIDTERVTTDQADSDGHAAKGASESPPDQGLDPGGSPDDKKTKNEDDEDFRQGGGRGDGVDDASRQSGDEYTKINSSIESDRALSQSDGTPRPSHVPRTATAQGLFQIGIQSINGVKNPNYNEKVDSRDEYDIVLSNHGSSAVMLDAESTTNQRQQIDEVGTTDSTDTSDRIQKDRISIFSEILHRLRR